MQRDIIERIGACLPKAGGVALGVMLTLPAFSVMEKIDLTNATMPGRCCSTTAGMSSTAP